MTQKIIRIGSSAGVTIPKRQLSELGLEIGDEVEVYFTKPGEITGKTQIITEFQKFMKLYGPTLRNLADR